MSESWQQMTLAGTRWTVRPDWRALLFDAQGLRWSDWRLQNRIELIKDAPHRSVFRVALDRGAVFIKHYPTRDWRARLRRLFQPTKARREWRRTLDATALHLPAVEPLALGEAADHQSYLITNEWGGATSLDRYLLTKADTWRDSSNAPARRRMIQCLAKFVARLHEAGLHHRDLYAGNLMIRERAPGMTWDLALIDLYAVTFGAPLDLPATIQSLSLFGNWLWPRTTPADRLRFWRSYVAARPDLPRHFPRGDSTTVHRIETAVWRRHLYILRQRSRRCIEANREFHQRRLGDLSLYAHNDCPRGLEDLLLADADAPLTALQGRLKASASSQVFRLTLNSQSFVYKRFAVTKLRDPVAHLLAGSPGRRSWISAWLLLEAGVPTPKPIAMLERRRAGLCFESYLVTEDIQDSQTLADHVLYLRHVPSQVRVSALRHLIAQIAIMIRRLHRYGISHRDLKASNWLVTGGATSTGPERVYLIDLVGVQRHRQVSRHIRVSNLARLATSMLCQPYVSNSDRLRFLKHYLPRAEQTGKAWKCWWFEIAKAVAAKVIRNQRRSRPLS